VTDGPYAETKELGVAGVLAFSVSSRTREFGIRLALGSQPGDLLRGVIREGVVMAAAGVLAGAAFGFVMARVARSYFLDVNAGSLARGPFRVRAADGRGRRVLGAGGSRRAHRRHEGSSRRVKVQGNPPGTDTSSLRATARS
jgi:hypothetical protein